MILWMPQPVRLLGLRLATGLDHLGSAQALLEVMGGQSVPAERYRICSRPMQRLILQYEPVPDCTPKPLLVCEAPVQGDLFNVD